MLDERASIGRRVFLALGTGTILGGCVQGGTLGGRETTRTTVPQGESPPSTADGETKTAGTNRPKTGPTTTDRGGVTIGGIGSNKNEPQATATIGETAEREPLEDEDGILVWNNATTARRITVTVAEKGASGKPLFREIYRFEPDAYVSIGIETPGKYVVSVTVNGSEPTTVDFTTDDCNYQTLFVTVMPDGSVRSSGMSTLRACKSVSIP